MQVFVDSTAKIAHVHAANILDTGWLGFEFARDNRDLVAAGWRLYYYGGGNEDFPGGPVVRVMGASNVASLIRASLPEPCCHDCCCRKGD